MTGESRTIGEVIESSTVEFLAESRELHSPPPFGSFVKVRMGGTTPAQMSEESTPAPVPVLLPDEDPFEDLSAFRRSAGSFNQALRDHMDDIVKPQERGPALPSAIYAIVYDATTAPVDSGRRLRAFWKDEEELHRDQPELSEWLLVTHFRAIVIGYCENGSVCQYLPPTPPRILAQVDACSEAEIRQITRRLDFLRTLANFRNAPTEEVVAACIREANKARGNDFNFLVNAGKELANLMKDDYDRLNAIMRRVAP